MPSVLPRTSWLLVADLSHRPACAAMDRGMIRRSSMTISPITNSATLRVLENGALKTGTPSCARGVDVDLVGADVEAPDRDKPVGRFEDFRFDLRARANADEVHAFDGLLKRVAFKRFRQALHVGITRGLHHRHGAVIHALEEENPDLVFGQRELRLRGRAVLHGRFKSVGWGRRDHARFRRPCRRSVLAHDR